MLPAAWNRRSTVGLGERRSVVDSVAHHRHLPALALQLADPGGRVGGQRVGDHLVGIAIATGTDVAVETADVALMRSDPLDVATAITISRGTLRKMRQNLAWAVGYNSLALPVAAGVFAPLGFILRPEVGAISMSGSSVIVAINAASLKRLQLPRRQP